MAGRGFAPKDPSRRARRNADPAPSQVLRFKPAAQPELPGGVVVWPKRTRQWWDMWGSAAQSDLFSCTDWDFLLDTALIHAAVWSGDLGHAAELRLRVSKFGATPEDRARLRMVFAKAEGKDAARAPQFSSAERFADLRILAPAKDRTAAMTEGRDTPSGGAIVP